MSDFEDKDEQVEFAKGDVRDQFHHLHPTDRAEAYRTIETWAGKRAFKQEEHNEEHGVPER